MSGGWTPGPWRVTTWGDGIVYASDLDTPIFEVNVDRDGAVDIYWPNVADAHLIAAAPALYEALRNMVEYAQAMGMDGWDASELSGEGLALIAARQALALARPSMEGKGDGAPY